MVWGARDRDSLHPAGQAGSERIHRAVQPDLSRRRARHLSLRIDRGSEGSERGMDGGLQLGAAPRQPRPGAAAHVSAEANRQSRVYFATVYLKGELTVALIVALIAVDALPT